MLPPLAKNEHRKVCDGCGKATFLPYTVRTGEPSTAVERLFCSLACARLRFPAFKSTDSGR